jgi:predicted DNA-binding transcriptional regulator YafY
VSHTERIVRLRRVLDGGRCVPREQMLRRLEVSPATLKRDIAFLRERLNVPLIFDPDGGGYRIDPSAHRLGTQYELPGLWLSAEEIHALLTMQHVLANLDTGGLLGPHIEPLIERLTGMLGAGNPREADVGEQIARRIRVQTVGARRVHLPHFQAVGSALLRRKRLVIDYHARGRDQRSEREVSPQRLIHYRDYWYLDAWCHLRRSLRSFSVDAISNVRALDKPAIDVPEGELDDVLGAGYGIFAGRDVRWATLRFSAERSRWVAAETWHPNQRGRFDHDGQWVLELPYADPRELVMDILRHVPEVEVLGPQELRTVVSEKLRAAAGRLTL